MSWAVTLLAAVAGAVAGMAGMFAIGLACVKWYKISSFEGGSGYFVVGMALLGVVGGFVLSIIAARLGCTYVGPHWYSQLGSALAAVLTALTVTWLYAYVGVDRIPELDGKPIHVLWEVRLPAAGSDEYVPSGDPRDWPDEELRLQLVSVSNHTPRGSSEAVFDRAAFRFEDEQWIVVARVPLFTSRGEFCVNLTLGGRDDGFWPPMRASLHPDSFHWSPWTRTNKGLNKPSDKAAVMYRFKFERS